MKTYCYIAALLVCTLLATRQAGGQIIYRIAGTTIAGFSGDAGQATSAQLNAPVATVVDKTGNIYISDKTNQRIRKVTPGGIITTVAGTGIAGFSGDGGQATAARLNYPGGIAVDTSGRLFITDQSNVRIRMVDLSGVITTVAGNGIVGYSGDGGQATSAALSQPEDVLVDVNGTMYIADYGNARIRRVTSGGIISTFAGTGTFSSSGDSGPATNAEIVPYRLARDPAGNLYAAEYWYQRVRKINTSGIITTFAGDGSPGMSGDTGPATAAQLNGPYGVAADRYGNIYINDQMNHRIRRVNPFGNIFTVAGNGFYGSSGDGGPALAAQIGEPRNVATDDSGNVYFADINMNVVRKITAGNKIPWFVAGTAITVHLCKDDLSIPLYTPLAISDTDVDQPITWTILTTVAHGTLSGLPVTFPSNGAVISPFGASYTPASGFVGIDSFVARVQDNYTADTLVVYQNVHSNHELSPISGPGHICIGDTVTFTDTATGGNWHNTTGRVTIATSGLATGITLGTDTIWYEKNNLCGADTVWFPVTVRNGLDAGSIYGPDTVCPMTPTPLTTSVSGGTWSSSNPAMATVDGTNLLTAFVPGSDTIMYLMAATGCATDTASLYLTIRTFTFCDASVTQATDKEPITIFPNPSTGTVRINLAATGAHISIQIHSITGQLLLSSELNDTQTFLDVDLPSGCYVVNATGNSLNLHERVIVTR